MNWVDKWKALSARIVGSIDIAKMVIHSLGANQADSFNAPSRCIAEFTEIGAQLKNFFDTFGDGLPIAAKTKLEEFTNQNWIISEHFDKLSSLRISAVNLQIFFSTFEYLIQDGEEHVKSITERAFLHLQRLIAVSENTRKEWCSAFDAHETKCEELGAVHLLNHGIWAIKINGIKAATDLIFPETDMANTGWLVARTGSALVCTEWKLVKNKPSEVDVIKIRNEAKQQLHQYANGVLSGLALKTTRYIVLVTAKQAFSNKEYDLSEGGIEYRCINICVDPDSPSKASKKLATNEPTSR